MATAPKGKSVTSRKEPVLPDQSVLKPMTGSGRSEFSVTLLEQAVSTLWYGSERREDTKQRIMEFGIGTMEEIAPRDGVEGLLAAQMVAVHATAHGYRASSLSKWQPFRSTAVRASRRSL